MSLIVVPLGAGEGITSVRHLARILASDQGRASRSPLIVVPDDCEQWPELQADADRGGFLLSIDAQRGIGARVEAALADVQKYRLSDEYRGSREGATDVLLIVPVFHAADDAAGAVALEKLNEVTAAIDTALTNAFRGTASIGFPNVVFVPWAFLPDGQSILSATALFKGPACIFGGGAKPIVRFAERRGMRNEWKGHGEMQLAIDLLALRALAADGLDFLPLVRPSGARPQFLAAHAAAVELPWTRLAKIGILRSLVGGNAPILASDPAPKDVEDVETTEKAERLVGTLRNFIDRQEVTAAAISLDTSASLAPLRNEFWEISFRRGADRRHERFSLAVQLAAAVTVNRVGGEALAEARTKFVDVERILQAELQGELTDPKKLPIGAGANRYARAAGRKLQALIDNATTEARSSIERIVTEVRGLYGSWSSHEQRLWDGGSRIPLRGAAIGATGAFFFAALVLAYLGFLLLGSLRDWTPTTIYASTLVTAIVAAAGFYFLSESGVSAYFAAWKDLEESMRGDMERIRRDLAAVCDQRVRGMKVASIPGLLRRLQAADNRLRTEIAGLTSLCREQLAQLESLTNDGGDAPEVGRFRFSGEIHARNDAPLADGLKEILRNVLTIGEAPEWISVEAYRELIEKWVREVVGSRVPRGDVKVLVDRALSYAASDRFMPAFNDAVIAEISTTPPIALCGDSIGSDVADARPAALPSEVAVFLTLRGYEMVREPVEAS